MTATEAKTIIRAGHKITGNTYPHKEAIRAMGCAWDPASKCWCAPSEAVQQQAQQLVDGTLYNSPPPADLTGDESPADMAQRHGRKAVAGAKAVQFHCYGLAKGDDGKPNGSIRRVKGRRYVQVARTSRRYLSQDMLEDFDLFDCNPGGSYQWTGVEIEPTDEELEADRAATAKADAKAQAPKLWEAAIEKIDQKVSAAPAWVTKDTLTARWHVPVMVHTGAYPEVHIGETEAYYHVPGYFACDWDYEPVRRVAPLTDAFRQEITAAVAACKAQGFIK